jgi:hypothetical protein
MSFPRSIRSVIPLVIGLAVGGAGAVLFQQSMPGDEGSPKERADKMEIELKRAQNRIGELEAEKSSAHAPQSVIERLATSHDAKRTLADGARRIAEDIRAGRPVSPDDIFRASQPLMRDLAPLFDRMRVRQQQKLIDSMTGELARKYNLAPQQQELLKQWFGKKSDEEAQHWSDLIGRDGTRLEDVMKASQDVRPDEGLDAFMPSILSGDKLAQFQSERLTERAQRVEQEANMNVQRLDAIVGLDETQRDQVFGIMARNSKQYDPQMVLQSGAGGQINAYQTGNRQEAMLSVLRPDQRAAYQAEQQRRRDEAAKDMEAMGLTLPANWEMFQDGFR